MKSPNNPHPDIDALETEGVDTARRRSILALAVAPALLVRFGAPAQAADEAACFDMDSMPPGEKSLRRSLRFRLHEPGSDERCGACAFYTATAGDCGTCQMLSGGIVGYENVCDSWALKS